MLDTTFPESQAPLLKRVQSLFPRDTRIKFVPSLTGMEAGLGQSLQLGGRAGLEVDLSNLLHEIGHLIDIDDARVIQQGWGLFYPEIAVGGRNCQAPETSKAVLREVRVIAWQDLLAEQVGFKSDPKEFIKSLRWMADFVFIPVPSVEKEDSREYDARRISWLFQQFETFRATLKIEEAVREIHRKSQVVTRQLNKLGRMV